MDNSFFDEQSEHSLIKSRIVSKYFNAWANVMLSVVKRKPPGDQHLAYADLFAGPGIYGDQNKSTPLMVLDTVLNNPDLCSRIHILFNDKNKENIEKLKITIDSIPNINKLEYPITYWCEEVGDEVAKKFERKKMVPTFFFVDPWGYKGLSLNLISSIIKDWGCDCVLFFNYNRISIGITNDMVKRNLVSIFGEKQYHSVREAYEYTTSPEEREIIVVEALCEALRNNGTRYVLPFRFKKDNGNRTSHHLIFISKHFLGYDIMKEIMAKESSESAEGVAKFEYNPRNHYSKQGSLLDMLTRPLEDLRNMLLKEYAGKTIDFMHLYETHSVDKPYIRKNYKEVLRKLYDDGLINAEKPKDHKPPKKGSFSDEMRITFGVKK